MSEKKEEFDFFGFRMIDRNDNEVCLSQFQDKDIIIIVNSKLVQESDEKAPLYVKLEDKFEKKVQILSMAAGRFFYEGHQDEESKRLICFLKQKANVQTPVDEEDGLTFLIDNKQHKAGHEVISCIGRNLTSHQLSDEISKHLK